MNDNGWYLNGRFTQLMETFKKLKMAIFRKRALILELANALLETESP